MNTSVLVYSCDNYSDVWEPFFKLFFKYWGCPYRVYITAETKKCYTSGVTTLNTQGCWTKRIRQAVEQIPTEYIIGMCEDMFFRRRVKQHIIDKCIDSMNANRDIACFNFEKEYYWVHPSNYAGFGRKPDGSQYRKSCQPTLWRRSVLLELLQDDQDAWLWEMSAAPDKYSYYIWTHDVDDVVFDYGYRNNEWFGIQKGKWVLHDVGPLFRKEGIEVDLSIRGVV